MTTRMEFAVTGMHCNSCGLLIDDEIEELPGVTSSTTDFRKERTVVELTGPIPAERIVAAIAEACYSGTHLA
ncbi:heavy metal-associated domain-containing protein [Streptomyces sp. NBC_01443]|uniref:heavy-metal-associated domain-containing protein n=1 Tax=Streptomyces sp. NBC_01443 TaxID=2903868 RepID=UPI00224CDFE5|nr:heavy metal-associated domain-containing protein [Streptomyces sp. NBC_01443]MCX4632436.1 heavy-metal-associated domain-containing protein [Streptomyces sp. NBC_01443]